METEKQGTGNAVNIPELPIMQIASTNSPHPADNLLCLQSVIEFLKDSVIAIGYNTEFYQETADGMVVIMNIISHDLRVIADQISIGSGKA